MLDLWNKRAEKNCMSIPTHTNITQKKRVLKLIKMKAAASGDIAFPNATAIILF